MAMVMEQNDRAALFASMERSGYLPLLRAQAQASTAPFWWFVDATAATPAKIRHNGSICFVHTGERIVGVTADHVYRGYLDDLRSLAVVCQIGSVRFQPERRVISSDKDVDLATFDVPEFMVAAAGRRAHYPPLWPDAPLAEGDLVIAGGYPGPLRAERGIQAEFPFVSLATRVRQSSDAHSALQLDLATSMWPGERLWPGADLGGMSGGPVFRFHGDGAEHPIEHLQVAGFIYEYNPDYEIMRARHGTQVARDGAVVPLIEV